MKLQTSNANYPGVAFPKGSKAGVCEESRGGKETVWPLQQQIAATSTTKKEEDVGKQ
jgi:hypothetical protein